MNYSTSEGVFRTRKGPIRGPFPEGLDGAFGGPVGAPRRARDDGNFADQIVAEEPGGRARERVPEQRELGRPRAALHPDREAPVCELDRLAPSGYLRPDDVGPLGAQTAE